MKISVIVPIYNMEKFIARAISCLKAQEKPHLEFILVNDGSTDSTPALIRELCADDARFHIYDMENKGYGHACNFGIRHATGDFFAIFEPDDCITQNFYSVLHDMAEVYPQADVIKYNGIYRVDGSTINTLYHWCSRFTGKILDKYTLKRFWRSHPSVFNGIYRKSFIQQKKVFFCETPGASFQDAMFMVSLFYANPSLFIVNDIKYYYTIHEMQSTKHIDEKIDFVIMAWEQEDAWLSMNGIKDRDFFLYRIFCQMKTLAPKISSGNKDILYRKFKEIKKNNIYLACTVPTVSQKLGYVFS